MLTNNYLYIKDNAYILFDRDSMGFYVIPIDIGEKLDNLEDDVRNEILEKTLASKRKNLCFETSSIDEEKCSRLVLVLAQHCNLACKYCYAEDGTYGDRFSRIMSEETAKNSIDRMIELFPKGISLIQFFGGEPLLNYKIIDVVCSYCNELVKSGKLEKLPQFAIVTNGTVINNEIIRLFNKYNINVTISLDGPKNVNDKQRIYPNNLKSVYDKIISTIDILNKNRNYSLCIEITLTQHFLDLPIYEQNKFFDFLASKKIDSIHFVPVIAQNETDYKIKDEKKLKKCIDLITNYTINISMSSKYMFPFKVTDFLSIILGKKQKKKHFCSAGITNFSIDTQGDIYGCFMMINPEKNMCMGNVNDKVFKYNLFADISRKFNNTTYDSCNECNACFMKGFCGNCIAASYSEYGILNKPIKNSCITQKVMFERLGYYLAKKISTESKLNLILVLTKKAGY